MAFDVTFPTDNDWGVPLLDIDRQCDMLPAPFVAWGSMARPTRMPGCYHFYVDDSKFAALWRNPRAILESHCTAVVEPNYSTSEQLPLAKVVWDVYRKRWLARFWQAQGINVLVDLNVAHACTDVNLLGVPKGWTAFATRYTSEGIAAIEQQYKAAQEHTGCKPSLVVYSGGREVQRACQERGWQWFPNQVTWQAGRHKRQGDKQMRLEPTLCQNGRVLPGGIP